MLITSESHPEAFSKPIKSRPSETTQVVLLCRAAIERARNVDEYEDVPPEWRGASMLAKDILAVLEKTPLAGGGAK